jgi:hypothetical protein
VLEILGKFFEKAGQRFSCQPRATFPDKRALGQEGVVKQGMESQAPTEQTSPPAASREPEAIYQKGQMVGRAVDAEIDLDAKEIRFPEMTNTDLLLLPEECEYQQYRILIQKIAYATKVHPSSAQKGRILKGAIAEILGYRQQ